jgi:hypothetical protein
MGGRPMPSQLGRIGRSGFDQVSRLSTKPRNRPAAHIVRARNLAPRFLTGVHALDRLLLLMMGEGRLAAKRRGRALRRYRRGLIPARTRQARLARSASARARSVVSARTKARTLGGDRRQGVQEVAPSRSRYGFMLAASCNPNSALMAAGSWGPSY